MVIVGILKTPAILANKVSKDLGTKIEIGRTIKNIKSASKNDTKKLFEIKSSIEEYNMADAKNKKHIPGDVLHEYLDKVERSPYEILTTQEIYHYRNAADRLLVKDGKSLRWEVETY